MIRAAAVLTWDGSRTSPRQLSAQAREFLGPSTPPAQLAKWMARGTPIELRICWVPRLQGGTRVLVAPFTTADGKRIAFRTVRTVSFADVLGVVYRRR